MKTQTINISGMSCSSCAEMITENLSQLDGVQHVTVVLDHNAAQISYDPETVTPNDFKKTIERTGYGYEGVEKA